MGGLLLFSKLRPLAAIDYAASRPEDERKVADGASGVRTALS